MADLHTHVIPGVDDGAPDFDSALATLRKLAADGISAVAATPHLNASNPNSQRRARADAIWPELVERARREVPDLELHRGFEIQLDTPDLDLSDAGLRLAGSRYALVEFYAFTVPDRSAEALARISANGHVPIVVHPERYWGYDRDFSIVSEWRRAGALVQVNSGSLLGDYGEAVRATALRFLQHGWVDLLASDNHARPERSPSLRETWDYLAKRGHQEKARLLLATNPHRILEDQVPVPVGHVIPRRSFIARIAGALKGESR
jgi:protein-tyrosine phosphatase